MGSCLGLLTSSKKKKESENQCQEKSKKPIQSLRFADLRIAGSSQNKTEGRSFTGHNKKVNMNVFVLVKMWQNMLRRCLLASSALSAASSMASI